jgi:hypothetical protein
MVSNDLSEHLACPVPVTGMSAIKTVLFYSHLRTLDVLLESHLVSARAGIWPNNNSSTGVVTPRSEILPAFPAISWPFSFLSLLGNCGQHAISMLIRIGGNFHE